MMPVILAVMFSGLSAWTAWKGSVYGVAFMLVAQVCLLLTYEVDSFKTLLPWVCGFLLGAIWWWGNTKGHPLRGLTKKSVK